MINDKLYEALPKLYIASGLANAVLLDTPLKYLPACALIVAGLVVLNWRYRARRRTQGRVRARLAAVR
jgi:hypothetical protein